MRRDFPAVPQSVSAARRFVREIALTEKMQVALDVVTLLTSELATNAIIFGKSEHFSIRVGNSQEAGGIRIEVVDDNPSPPELRQPRSDEIHGRGLLLVNQLASAWGSYGLPGAGKVVWFEL